MTAKPDHEAAEAIRAHHVELHDGLRIRVLDLQGAVRAGRVHDTSLKTVSSYLEDELLPHAIAEERALYPVGDTGLTALLVRAMREEHKELIARVDSLRTAADGIEAAVTAGAILALFESHLWKENELLVPAFVADPNVSLSDLLIGMHELVG